MRICVFCGSSAGRSPVYAGAASRLGRTLAERGVGLVYGGASVGLMGAVADAALEAGGEVIGVIPRSLVERELAHGGLDELHVVETMHERKALMSDLSDGFVALPGGAGTLDELFEAFTWGQLGIHSKPCGLLDVAGFWHPLVETFDRMTAEGFIRPEWRETLVVADEPEELLRRFAAHVAPTRKWTEKPRA